MKKNKNKIGVGHKSCASSHKTRKCRSCKTYKILLNKRLMKQLDTKKENKITKMKRVYTKNASNVETRG